MDASNLQPGAPMEYSWSLQRVVAEPMMTPAPGLADITSIVDDLVHAADLVGRGVDSISQDDLARAIGDFEWSLTFHVQAAIRSARLADAAEQRGEGTVPPLLRSQSAVLFWRLPDRARTVVSLLRTAAARTDAVDPAESLRFIAERALCCPEARMVLGDESHERLGIAVRAAFTEPVSRSDGRVTRIDPCPPAAAGVRPRPPTAAPAVLSTREREVVCLIAEGLTNRGIGYRLGVKAITINTFVTRIFGKLGVDNRAAAAAYAVRHGFCNG
jgi:DNA-binding CsgD family transcriptional regulator